MSNNSNSVKCRLLHRCVLAAALALISLPTWLGAEATAQRYARSERIERGPATYLESIHDRATLAQRREAVQSALSARPDNPMNLGRLDQEPAIVIDSSLESIRHVRIPALSLTPELPQQMRDGLSLRLKVDPSMADMLRHSGKVNSDTGSESNLLDAMTLPPVWDSSAIVRSRPTSETEWFNLQHASSIFVTNRSLLSEVRSKLRTPGGVAPLVLYKRSRGRTSEDIQRSLQQQIRAVSVMHSLPTDSVEAEKVHPGEGRYFDTPYWDSIRAPLEATGVPAWSASRTADSSVASQIRARALDASADTLLLIVGHVERGWMRFADGSGLAISALSKAARAPIVFLGCNTLNHIEVGEAAAHAGTILIGTGVRVEYEIVVQMVSAIARIVQAHPDLTLEQLLREFQDAPELTNLMGVVELRLGPAVDRRS